MNSEIHKIIAKRILSLFIVLFFMISFLFILFRIAPGDPANKYLSPKLSPQLLEKVRQSYNPEGSVFNQYTGFVINTIKGNLGISYSYHTDVTKVIGEFLPFTIVFSLITFIVQFSSGFILAVLTAGYLPRFWGRYITKLNFILFATPSFVTGVLLIYIFSEKLALFPSSGIKSIAAVHENIFSQLYDHFVHLVLPVVCLALSGIPVYYKYIKDGIEQNSNKLFVQYLRANGVSENKIFYKHIIPNSINPVIAQAGIDLGMLFSSVLVTEVIFSLPGMGRLAVGAILNRDFPLVIGCTLVAGVLMVITNLAADFIRILLDKRLIKGVLN